jgi:hypothetical protein
MEDIGMFYCYLVYFTANWCYFMAIWYISWSSGIFWPVLVSCTKKNLATLPTYVIDEGFLKPSQPYCLIHNIEQAKPDFHF